MFAITKTDRQWFVHPNSGPRPRKRKRWVFSFLWIRCVNKATMVRIVLLQNGSGKISKTERERKHFSPHLNQFCWWFGLTPNPAQERPPSPRARERKTVEVPLLMIRAVSNMNTAWNISISIGNVDNCLPKKFEPPVFIIHVQSFDQHWLTMWMLSPHEQHEHRLNNVLLQVLNCDRNF